MKNRFVFFAQDESKKVKNKKKHQGTSFSDTTGNALEGCHSREDMAVSSEDVAEHGTEGRGDKKLWLKITVRQADPMTNTVMFEKVLGALEKVGKKKKDGGRLEEEGGCQCVRGTVIRVDYSVFNFGICYLCHFII